MATYEVLEPGGHARLVSDIKDYANRAGGVGTTQIADESVTSAKLADDVTDTLDDIESFTDPMNKNGLHGELSEGAVLTADDVYAAPPKSVEVYGKSTQAGTPTPDAPVEINSVDDLTLHVCGKNLFDPSHLLEASGWTVSDGVYTGNIGDLFNKYGSKNSMYPIGGLVGTQQYTVSLDYVPTDATKTSYIGFVYTDDTIQYTTNAMISAGRYSFTSNGSKTLAGLIFSYANGQVVHLSNIQFESGTTATAYAPYVGASVSIPLSNNIARSLPDGTRDTLTLTYQGPSETAGYGVFGTTLQQLIGSTTTAATDGITGTVGVDVLSTTGEIADGPTVIYKLATPITHDLGTVELPVNPAPDLTAWADGGSAQPTMAMEYERDVNIVISNMMSAIADAATS